MQRKSLLNEVNIETGFYEAFDGARLELDIFRPEIANGTVIIFFFGGGWRIGGREQFHPHCLHLAEFGLTAISADYRVQSRHNTTMPDSVRDARNLMSWIKEDRIELGIDIDRIVLGGGSAGGHLALCTAFDSPLVPKAYVLFNPVYDTTKIDLPGVVPSESAEEFSPLHRSTQ